MKTGTVYPSWPGDSGTLQTVYMMRELVNKSYLHPHIRERAASMVSNCRRAIGCEHGALLSWVHNAVQYVRDPIDVETLTEPVSFMEGRLRAGVKPFGDCDDMSTYLAALLKSIGHAPLFRVLSRSGNGFHHVHVVCHGTFLDPTLLLGQYPTQAVRAIQIKI